MNKIIDLTHKLNNDIAVYPGTSSPEIKQINFIEKDYYAERSLKLRTHSGTHIDAPCHIVLGAKTLDELPLESFIGKGLVIDCTEVENNDISLDFIKQYEDKIKEADFIIIYAAWYQKWGSKTYFNEFPVLNTEATEWLIKQNIKGIGYDSISADQINCQQIPNHRMLLANEVLIVENLKNLDQLIGKDFEFNAIPLNIEGSDGSPIRAFARM